MLECGRLAPSGLFVERTSEKKAQPIKGFDWESFLVGGALVSGMAAQGLQRIGGSLVGGSAWIRRIQSEIRSVAPFSSSILVSGPSGTGKELIARAIHAESPRSEKPFIPVNCAAISGTLFESHMFGHLKGAFTGSNYSALGCFRAADGGTIFLDEIGELEPSMQAKLLRVLQEGMVMPVGSHEEQSVDVRVVAATNRDLPVEVTAGRFREDLYYRLAVVSLRTLSLAERRDDIPLLTDFLLSAQSVKNGLPFKPVSASALHKLLQHSWPGNVRELQNVLERAVVMSRAEVIGPDDILLEGGVAPRVESLPRTSEEVANERPVSVSEEPWPTLDEMERQHLLATLQRTGNNQSAAAKLLGMDRGVLRRRIKKFGLDVS